MIIYVFRHGESETKAESPQKTNESRRLTSEGRDQVKTVCEAAKKLGCNPRMIISSPLVRARQTAEIAKEILNPRAELKEENCLEPESDLDAVYSLLSKQKNADSVVLVSHLPLIGYLIRDLLDWQVERKNLDMDPGAMIRIDTKTRPKSGSGN